MLSSTASAGAIRSGGGAASPSAAIENKTSSQNNLRVMAGPSNSRPMTAGRTYNPKGTLEEGRDLQALAPACDRLTAPQAWSPAVRDPFIHTQGGGCERMAE